MILIGFVAQTWGRLLSVCALSDRRADCLDLAKVEKSSWTTWGLLLQEVSLVQIQANFASLKIQASSDLPWIKKKKKNSDLPSPAHSIAIVAAPAKHKQLKHHTTRSPLLLLLDGLAHERQLAPRMLSRLDSLLVCCYQNTFTSKFGACHFANLDSNLSFDEHI